MARKRSQASLNASTLATWIKAQAKALPQLQWSSEQIAGNCPKDFDVADAPVVAHGQRG
jgi:hypothetical protein